MIQGTAVWGIALLCLCSVGVVAADEAPQADAGLDQEAAVNDTVYLDARGSLDPDGSIARYGWTIEAPNGTTVAPDCPDCPDTWFVPGQAGRYNVTVRVTDESGADQTDTLYVWVDVSGSLPDDGSSDVTDPESPGGGSPAPITDLSSSGGTGPGNAMVVETGEGLMLSGGINQDEYRIPVGDEMMTVSGERFSEGQTSGGRAPLTEFRMEMEAAAVAIDDVRDSINDDSCTTSGGNACTGNVDESTYNDQMASFGESLPELSGSSSPIQEADRSFESTYNREYGAVNGETSPSNTGTSMIDEALDTVTDAWDSSFSSDGESSNDSGSSTTVSSSPTTSSDGSTSSNSGYYSPSGTTGSI